jgi:hypothetical protein
MTTRAENVTLICLDDQEMKSAISAPAAFNPLHYSIWNSWARKPRWFQLFSVSRRCDRRSDLQTMILDLKINLLGVFTPVKWESGIYKGKEKKKKKGNEDNGLKVDNSLTSSPFTFEFRWPLKTSIRQFVKRSWNQIHEFSEFNPWMWEIHMWCLFNRHSMVNRNNLFNSQLSADRSFHAHPETSRSVCIHDRVNMSMIQICGRSDQQWVEFVRKAISRSRWSESWEELKEDNRKDWSMSSM